MTSHTGTDQPPPRVDLDEFATNRPLVEAVQRYDAGWAVPLLHEAGRHVGTAQFQHDGELANPVPPVLNSFDRYGNRIDQVEYHPAYHRIIRRRPSRTARTPPRGRDPRPGANVARAAPFMLFAAGRTRTLPARSR